MKKTDADAWIVQSSPAEVLEWFASQDVPFIALHGRFMHLDVAAVGVSMIPPLKDAVDRLVSLGHRRIVMLTKKTDIMPTPGKMYQSFFGSIGIPWHSDR